MAHINNAGTLGTIMHCLSTRPVAMGTYPRNDILRWEHTQRKPAKLGTYPRESPIQWKHVEHKPAKLGTYPSDATTRNATHRSRLNPTMLALTCPDCADGSALVTVLMGNTVVYRGRITHGRALPEDSYTGRTSEATVTSRRRVDTSLATPGEAPAAVTGISSAGQLVTITLVGQVTSVKLERGCPRRPLFFHEIKPEITVGRLERWYQLHTGTAVQVRTRPSGDFLVGDRGVGFRAYTHSYDADLPPELVGIVQAAHSSTPLLVDIVAGGEVCSGRMVMVVAEERPQQGQHLTEALANLVLHEGATCLSLQGDPNRPHQPPTVRQTMHLGAAAVMLAASTTPLDSPAAWQAYATDASQQASLRLATALSPAAATTGPAGGVSLYSSTPLLTELLDGCYTLAVDISGFLTLTLTRSRPPPIPRLGIVVGKVSGRPIENRELPALLWSLDAAYRHPDCFEPLIDEENEEGRRLKATLSSRPPRPITLTSTHGDLLTLVHQGGTSLLARSRHPLTNQVRNNPDQHAYPELQTMPQHRHPGQHTHQHAIQDTSHPCFNPIILYHMIHTTHTRTDRYGLQVEATPHEPQELSRVVRAFSTVEGLPLYTRPSPSSTQLLILPGSNEDMTNLLGAIQSRDGRIVAGDTYRFGLQRSWMSYADRNSTDAIWVSDIGSDQLQNLRMTGLDYITDQQAFTIRAVVAVSESTTLGEMEGANQLHTLQSAATKYMILARTATDANATFADAVLQANTHAPAAPPPAATSTQTAASQGWRVARVQASAATLEAQPARPAPTQAAAGASRWVGRPLQEAGGRQGQGRGRGGAPPTHARSSSHGPPSAPRGEGRGPVTAPRGGSRGPSPIPRGGGRGSSSAPRGQATTRRQDLAAFDDLAIDAGIPATFLERRGDLAPEANTGDASMEPADPLTQPGPGPAGYIPPGEETAFSNGLTAAETGLGNGHDVGTFDGNMGLVPNPHDASAQPGTTGAGTVEGAGQEYPPLPTHPTAVPGTTGGRTWGTSLTRKVAADTRDLQVSNHVPGYRNQGNLSHAPSPTHTSWSSQPTGHRCHHPCRPRPTAQSACRSDPAEAWSGRPVAATWDSNSPRPQVIRPLTLQDSSKCSPLRDRKKGCTHQPPAVRTPAGGSVNNEDMSRGDTNMEDPAVSTAACMGSAACRGGRGCMGCMGCIEHTPHPHPITNLQPDTDLHTCTCAPYTTAACMGSGRTWRSNSGQQLTKHAHASRRSGREPTRRNADSGDNNGPPPTFNPIAATRAVYVAWLLLAAGDVEANPGPTTRHFMQDKDSFACQIYSLNNAAGHEWVTTHDVDTFYETRLPQLTDHLERGAWLMARGVDGYSDEVIEMYLRIHYGLAVQSIAQLNQPSDWSADNLGNLAGQYGTHTFLCKKTGHSMAMKCIDGTWNLLDSMETTPTPLSHIPTATMRTMHQLFVITPNTRSREQMRMCAEKDIHHIISHVEPTGHGHNATTVDPAHPTVTARHIDSGYMERQHEECCLVHAFNMAMGRKCIDYQAVISHCKQLAEHLQHLAQEARAAGHTIQTLKTDHIYHAKGKFSSDTLNHYLHRKHHEMRMYLHLASTYLPTQSITPETITNAITSTGATHTEAVILLSHQHATAIKHTPHGWHQLDSFNRVPKPLSTPDDWSSLQGNILTICTGDVRHTRFIRREIWIADPLEATTPTALAAHFRDHLDPIDLTTDHTEARETPGPLHVTTTTAETSCTTDSTRRATAEGIPPHDEPTRLRQRQDTPTVTLRPQTTTRIHRPTTPLDTATDAAKKRVRVTKRHGNDTHTQTLMFKYLCKPTAKTRNTGPISTIDEATKSTPDTDLGTNQHHSPPPPPTPNRQHITLTTFNVRGLHRSRNEVLNLVHSQSPDILILTETMTQPRSNNPSSGWLKRVMPNYTVHRHQGHSEVLIGIRHDLAIQTKATMIQPCTDADVNTRCVILSLRQRQSEELTLVATYWPSGNNDDAIPLRRKMQEHIRAATGHLPGSLILAGDINATMKTEDRSEHTEYTQDTMMREFATEMRLSEADPGDRAWTYQQPHCNSRIDAILTRDARHGPEHRTQVDTNAYLSDHRPLTATLSTARLGIDLAAPQKPQKHSHTILTTPITNKDREAYRLAVQQPSSGAPQLHAHLTAYLAPMYTDAIHFLTTIDKANPQQPQRLTLVAGLPAREAIDTAATMLTTLLQTCRTTAIKTCNTKTLTRGGQHYQRRTMCRIRQALGKKLKTTRELSRKARVFFKQNNVHPTIDELIPETDTTNAETREAVQARQGDDTTENHVQAALAQLTNSYRDQIHKLDDDDSALAIAQARVRMQQLISTQPKKANKYILRPSRTDHKGLQALADPITNKIHTAPADLNRIITEAYGTKLAPPTPKTGNYTNTQTRNYPWARAKADDPFTMHTCQNVHWLHTAIMDKAGFQECLSRLSGGKAPGPDGIENEIMKMLPWEMRDTIHQLFITMWATGCTPTTWKTSDTCLLYKDKGQETDLNSYRPVGLANTVYKLWTSLITKILSEYAEANGMLSKNQAGFRSHRNTTQQLQMLVMALEDAKLAKADIYALLVDFTSAFNTTCQDKLLWIMHDLGFPTDATDAVKDLYTGATTRFRTPYGPTDPVPVDRGTIQGDSLSPFLFLIYIEPLLRWLQVGARGYKFKSATADSGERTTVSSIDYADDIAILCNTLRNLRCQADKLSAFSDWGHLIISHSKTLATAALHHSIETGMCSNAAEADKWARQQLQTVSLQGKPVTYHRPTSPFTYLGVLITMTLDWKPQHTAMITQLRQKLERLRRSFASARQAIHIIRTAIIPSLAYSFCAVPCTPGDLELYDRSINQCVKLKLRLPLGTPNAIVREDAGKLGMGISSTAQEYHARNTTALTQSLQSTDATHSHISRSMLHKQITWLNTLANNQGHRMLTLFHHTLRARQLVYTSLAGLAATEGGLPLYPEECHTLGRLITQANSSHAHDVVSASITCLKSLGITHACELSCEGNTHIITGSMLTSKYGKKVKQKHIIALNKLAAMAAQPSCPDATATRTIRDSRNTSLNLPPAQRKITPWAAGLTELAPTPTVPDTRTRYMDMKAYAALQATQPATADRATAAPAVHDATRTSSRLLKREQRATQPPPTKPNLPKAGTKRNNEGRQTQTIPQDIVRIVGLDLPGLSSWKVDKACRCKPKNLGCILGAMYGHQEAITSIDGWQWDGINKENYYKVHWKPTVIDRWALSLCAEEGYTPTHIETISREEAKDVCTCELCWLPRGDNPTCHNCKRAYHPACLEEAHLSGHKEPGYWLCPICKFGSNDFKTTMRQSAHSDLIRVHWHPTLEPAPLITAHLDYIAKRNDYDEENRQIQEARHARPDTHLPAHTRQGLPDPHTWLPRCTNLHSKATFHTYPTNPQTDIVGTGNCETFLQLHPHMTDPAMSLSTGEPIMPRHDLVQHVTVHDESGRTAGLLTKDQHQHLHTWLQHTPHTRNLATEVVALLRRQDAQSSHHPMRGAQDKALNTLHATRSFPSTVQRWADPLTVRPETTTYWSPDINDTAFGAHHNCLLVRHTGLSTWNVPADDAVALKCVNHAIHSATQEEAMATIMLIPGKKGISYPKHIDTLRRYPEYCQHLASIPPTKTRCPKPGKHANLHIYVIWNAAGQQLVTKGNPQGWLTSTATALHPQRDTHPIRNRPTNQSQPATLPSGHKQHMRLPLDKDLPTSGHQRGHHQLTHHSTTQPRMAITEWATLAYTDGSCIKTSGAAPASVGAGVYIPETNVLITVALDDPESNTINKAELTAIHAALTAGAKRIATDSLCSIYQIRRALANPMSLITHRHNDILTAIATLIIDSPVTIHFYKVRAHSGIIGNEGADALAKQAALHPELANTPAYRPTTRTETNTWLTNEADGNTPAPLPDCRHSVRAHMHRRHSLGLANQDSIYYQMSQEITKAAAKGAGERVMTDTNISIPAQRTALLYRTGGLYNQKLAMRWKRATDDRCPLCGEADSATHLLSGCSETLPMVQERHNGAGRLIAKAISKGTLGGYISFADTGSWEKGAKEDLDLPNDTLHTPLRALGLQIAATKNTTRPDILMVMPTKKTGTRGKAIKRVIIIEIKYCSDSRQGCNGAKQQPEAAQPSPAQPSPAQPSPAQPSPAQPSPAQPSPAQPSPAQPSPAKPSPALLPPQPPPSSPYHKKQVHGAQEQPGAAAMEVLP
ncbi:hypothetical protein QJQ45_014732, partial [Haematococcus lacustris]